MTIEHPTPLPPIPLPSSEPPFSLRRILLGLVLAVAMFDFCFWGVNSMGFSVALFCSVLAVVILCSRESLVWRPTTIVLCVLLVGASFAAAVETGTTNTMVLVVLIIALAGDSYFSGMEMPWARWYSQVVALVFAPGRVIWLGLRLLEAVFGKGLGWTGGIIGGCLLSIPALVLALVFGSLLASGNAVFGSWTNNFFDWFWKELDMFFNIYRITLWGFIAVVVLPLLRPAWISSGWWTWIPRLPRLPELVPTRGAVFSSAMILVILNLIFLVANVADAMFLWSGAPLPAGVQYKSYVHEGVNTLIFTVFLTAIVLTTIFQQALTVSGNRALKILALAWIAQNVFLLTSCALRLKHYIDESQLTVARLSCLIFLALVTTGFVLLTIKIIYERSLAWLVGGCLLAIFIQFYLTQFLDLAGYAMNYNVARFEREPVHRIDTWKLYEAGPAGWPAARRAHAIDPSIKILNNDPTRGPWTTYDSTLPLFDKYHWREFSLRAYWNRWALDDKK